MANPMQVITHPRSDVLPVQKQEQEVRILVVDDDDSDFFVINRMLKKTSRNSYRVVHADNLDKAVAELKGAKYDAVLVDYHIGDRLGTDIFEELDDDIEVPVILLTGSDSRDVEEAALEAGAFDFLDKNALSGATLTRSLDFAIKRFEVEQKIRANQERLRRACENAEAAHFSKSEFLAFLGSELQTPLNAIIGFSQVMKEDSLTVGMPNTYREYSDTIHSSGVHLSNLIDDLLDLSETDAESFDSRQRRFKRYRTWIFDQQETRAKVRVSA